eukprot:Pompholyxophrys_sp_v1_NODE_386_length_629_cov_10.184669.p1 type:complete len:114 gc:universal NODE_386_length_629_cov_10.184669:144-485(+)
MLKLSRLLSPAKVRFLNPTIKDAAAFEIFHSSDVESLKLPTYVALAQDFVFKENDQLTNAGPSVRSKLIQSEVHEVLDWWRNHRFQIPTWFEIVKKLLLLQMSSGTAERVFQI